MKSMHQPVIVSAVQTPLGSFAITEALESIPFLVEIAKRPRCLVFENWPSSGCPA